MSDESKQLSVAELLARNGQQGASSSGGGRRRRGGRGISVAELTGDLPVIREGGSHSAHAAPDDEVAEAPSFEPASYAPTSFEPPSFESPSYEPAAYEPAAFEPVASEPVSYTAPDPVAELPSHSPMSGPITRYDPLAPYRETTSYPEPTPYPATSYSDPPPGRSNLVMPGRDMSSGSRHSAPDPLESATPYADPLSEAPRSGRGGRRRKPDPDEDATIVVGPPLRDPVDFDIPRNGHPDEPRGSDRQERGGRAARRRAAEADDTGPSTAAWAPPSNDFAADSGPLPLSPLPDHAKLSSRAPSKEARQEPRRSSRSETLRARAEGALPAWSARTRHKPEPEKSDSEPESGGIPTAAWSLASQDQQLVSGSTVAGDLLRDGVERAERAGGGRGRSRGGRAQVELDEGLTDVHDPFLLDDEEDEDDAPAPQKKPAARSAQRRSRAARKAEYDANRKQWMILGGQSAGAAVAGMLLFKGFERMWEMLPWVALALAMIVILGLVALVRILRRTDDILSTVIAVVVGIFVTLGPLAFLLSTN
ncbi:hypothetical protein APR12_006707 [Nocardia amikacinitolerans]|uniref:hypothetical protein n=1 Tax=Nocardia amikacinitolerans TaxID=756689 RepID=UPI0008295023|nr:hypothetical protein [Nocardia amikacinitolerans]MCP2321316.1 hypothetical protein [Nocardia amikacinitolerans]